MRPSVVLFLIIATLALAQHRVTLDCPDENKCCMCKSVYYVYSTCFCSTGNNSSFVFSIYWSKYLTIRCENSPNWKDFYFYNGSYSLAGFNNLLFDQCELPEDFNLINVNKGFYIKNIEALTFKNGKTENWEPRRNTFKGFSSLRQLSLPNNGLKKLPSDLFEERRYINLLSLKDNELNTLPKDIFWTLRDNLFTLDLSNNKISYLENELFRYSSGLRILDLSGNLLTKITDGMFIGLYLRELNVESNNVDFIENKALGNLKHLEIARFSHNRLAFNATLLNSPFQNCSHLRELYLGYNNISKVFDDFVLNKRFLEVLDLQHNSIESIKERDISFISNNITVDLTYNKIKHINLDNTDFWAQLYEYPDARLSNGEDRNVTVRVDNNPIICDCKAYNFLRHLKGNVRPNQQKLFKIIPGELKCRGPENFFNVPVAHLSSEEVCDSMKRESIGPQKTSAMLLEKLNISDSMKSYLAQDLTKLDI